MVKTHVNAMTFVACCTFLSCLSTQTANKYKNTKKTSLKKDNNVIHILIMDQMTVRMCEK